MGDEPGMYVHAVESGARRRLTELLTAGGPAWSPDGETFAFASSDGASTGVFLIAVDGTDLRPLASPAGALRRLAWSRDGSTVLVHAQDDAETHMWAVRADGSGMERLIQLDAPTGRDTAWSPDGEWIVYARSSPGTPSHQGLTSLYAANVHGGQLVRVTGGHQVFDDHPSWSRDGRKIAFIRRPGGDRPVGTTHIAVIDVSELFPDVVANSDTAAGPKGAPPLRP
jgi:TolB protein